MKKVYLFIVSWALCLLAVGCSDDEKVKDLNLLRVITSEVSFGAQGGEGVIVLEAVEAISAASSESWCSVSVQGNEIRVTAAPNLGISSRSALVTIKSGEEVVDVAAYQLGDVFETDLKDSQFASEGGNLTFSLKILRDWEISGLPSWMSYTVSGENITFTAEEAPVDRMAKVSISCDGVTYASATFTQLALMDVSGVYDVNFQDSKEGAYVGQMTISRGEGKEVNISIKGMYLDCGFKGVYDENTRLLSIPANQFLGYVDGWAVYLVAYAESTYIAWDSNMTYIATGKFDENGKVNFEFRDSGTWKDNKIIGFYFACFDKLMEDGGEFAGSFWPAVINWNMTKQ